MITFAQGGGEMRQGGKDEGRCGVIELMKNWVLKAQRFAHLCDWGLRHPSGQLAPSLGDVQPFFYFLGSYDMCRRPLPSPGAWIGRIWLTIGGLNLASKRRFNSCPLEISGVCWCHPNTRVGHLRLNQTHKKQNDQTLWEGGGAASWLLSPEALLGHLNACRNWPWLCDKTNWFRHENEK